MKYYNYSKNSDSSYDKIIFDLLLLCIYVTMLLCYYLLLYYVSTYLI